MRISEFQKYIALYGADLSRWPRHEIRPALDLIQHDPEAGKIFSGAEKLDQMFRHYAPIPVNVNGLADRIVRQAKHGIVRAKQPVLNPAYLFVPGGGLLVAAILGFMIGFHATAEAKETLMLDSVLYTQDHVMNDSEENS